MTAEELIETLSRDVAPVSRHWLSLRLASGLALGGLVTLALICGVLGLRPDLWLAMHGGPFWMKWTYTASLGLCALAATARLARPDPGRLGALWIMALPVLGLAMIGLVDMAHTPRAQWLAMWLGMSWKVCSSLVFALSVPIFAGLVWSYRSLAPTRLRAAGATAGLAAGAWSATLYCLHCPEVSAIFVITWYTLGIVLAACFGAILGPRLLRW